MFEGLETLCLFMSCPFLTLVLVAADLQLRALLALFVLRSF